MKNYQILVFIAWLLVFPMACQQTSNSKDGAHLKTIEKTSTTKQVNFIGQWYHEGNRELLVRNIAREYEFQNQNVKVNLKFPEEIYYQREDPESNAKFVANIITQKNPEWDIIRIIDDFAGVYKQTNNPNWAKDYLVDFSAIQEFRDKTKPELLNDSIKRKWGGIIPGPFLEGQYWALWYNSKVAEKMGIKIKNNQMTVDDFVSYIKDAHAYNQHHRDSTITPLFEAGDWQTAGGVFFQMMASCFDNSSDFLAQKASKERLNNWHKVLKVAEELAAYDILNPNYKQIAWGESISTLLNEECLFYVNGSWMYNIWLSIDKEKTMNCVPAEFPVFKETNIYPGGYQIMWAVLKNAPNKETAIDFLLKLNSEKVGQDWVRYTKCPTGIKTSMAEVSFGVDQFEDFSSYIQRRYSTRNYKYTEDGNLIAGEDNSNKKFYLRAVLTGEMSADEAIGLMN